MRKIVELRIRNGNRPGFRYEVGVAKSRTELGRLYRQRDLLRRLHGRGEHDVLQAVKDGRTTAPELERLIDAHGVDDYRKHLRIDPPRPKHPAPTLDDHVVHWLETIPKAGTKGVYRKSIAHLRDFQVDGQRLGDRPWPEVPRHVIRDAKTSLRGKLAPNTIRTVMAAWSGFYEWAIEREKSQADAAGRPALLDVNPVRAAKAWDPIEFTRHRFPSWDEFQKLLEVSAESMRPQYATLALGGLRIGELLTLPPAHVHLPTHIHVGPFGDWVPKGYPRSKRGVRDVPLHRDLVPLLEMYAERYAGAETFFVNPRTGRPWDRSNFDGQLRRDVTAAGMVFGQWSRSTGELERKRDGITAHTLRHATASWLAAHDVQLQKIALILGDTVETITKHYAHLLPSDLDRSINRIGVEKSGIASGTEGAE